MVPVSSKEHPLSTRRGSSVNAQGLLSWTLVFVLSNDSLWIEESVAKWGKTTAMLRGKSPALSTGERTEAKRWETFHERQIQPNLCSSDEQRHWNIHWLPSGQFFLSQVLSFRKEVQKSIDWKWLKVFIAMAIHFLKCLQTGPWKQIPAPKETQNCSGQGAMDKVSWVNIVMASQQNL